MEWQQSLPLDPTHKICVRLREATLPHTPYCLPPTHSLLFSVIKVISNAPSPPYTLSRPAILKLGWAAESPATTYTFQSPGHASAQLIPRLTTSVFSEAPSLPGGASTQTVWDPEAQPRQSLARQHVQKSRLKKLRAFLSVTKYWQLLCTWYVRQLIL